MQTTEFGYWLSGLIDGEGCFKIVHDSRVGSQGTYGCRFTLELRWDDLGALRQIVTQTGLGRIRKLNSTAPNRPKGIWAVSSKTECQQLATMLSHHPLRTKKARDFAVWHDALRELATVNSHPGKLAPHDWTTMRELKSELHTTRRYSADERTATASTTGLLPWLGGLIDGEGCFQIVRRNGQPRHPGTTYACTFTLGLRDDDAAILTTLHEVLGIGTLMRHSSGRANTKPTMVWQVQSKGDCQRLCKLIDNDARLRAKKASDYEVWADAVDHWLTVPKGRPNRGEEFDWTQIADLAAELKSTREYREPPSYLYSV